MKRRLTILLTAALCLLTINARAAEITLLHGWGTMEKEHVAMREIYSGFEKVRPDVKLTLISLPDTDQAIAKAADMLSVGEAPDILFMAGVNSSLFDFMVEKGYALNLAPYLAADAELRASVSPLTLRSWQTEDGALYTVTDVLWLNGLWVNRTVAAQAGIRQMPENWQDFFDVCDRIQAWSADNGRDVQPIALTLEDTLNLTQFILSGMEDNPSIGTSDRLADALEILKRLYAYTGDALLSYQYRDTLSLFNQGRTVFYVNGIWASGMIDENVNAQCVAFPGEKGTVSGQSALCGYVLGNTGDPERMAASVAFIKYMLSEETQGLILTRTGQFPSNPSLRFDTLEGVSQRFLTAKSNIQGAAVGATTLGLTRSAAQEDSVIAVFRDYLTDKLTVAEAVAAVRAIMNP